MSESPPLYSSAIITSFLKLVRSRYGHVNIADLLARAGMEPYQVEDEGHWFTQEQVDSFHETLVRATHNSSIAREAGRYSASPEGLGLLTRYVLGLAGPAKVFETIGTIAGNLTRSTSYTSRRISRTEIELTVVPLDGVAEKPYQCENRIGYFEAIVAGFDYRMPRIVHDECIFKGGKACTYAISWRESGVELWKRIRLIASGAAILGTTGAAGLSPWLVPLLAGGSIMVILILSLICERLEKRELSSAIENLRSTSEEFLRNANRNYTNALMINEMGHIISKYNQTDALLAQVMELLRKRLEYDRGLILLVGDDGKNLEFRSGYGYGRAMVKEMRQAVFHLDRPDSQGVFVRCHRERRSFLVNDVSDIENNLSKHSLKFLKKIGSKSFICCPILYEDACIGILAVDNVTSKRPLVESDINLLMGIAPEIGISVHNALMTEERELQFRSILRTLAASIDARDNLTAGHSERVTEYSMAICAQMGIPNDLKEVIRVASQLHDYGKIGIQDSILKKSGPLSIEEREEIKTHVVKTRKILEEISFSGMYRQVPFIAGSHHERLDGTGYPQGLKGKEIPLGARIIAVADFFEAITAKRHYHEPLSIDEAVKTLMAESGHHMDQTVIEALVSALHEGKITVPTIELMSPAAAQS
ncbi:MAG: phosphohydrolase [Spirochaetes bacterium GWB1_59_5]|nr:MAG: phosphohydrolase [Spirochaetes bacterium GWB1_59_5]